MAWEELEDSLGYWFARQRARAGGWKLLFLLALAGLVALNVFILPEHPHFELDRHPGFWAAFGLGVTVIMTVLLKKIIAHVIGRREDYYDH